MVVDHLTSRSRFRPRRPPDPWTVDATRWGRTFVFGEVVVEAVDHDDREEVATVRIAMHDFIAPATAQDAVDALAKLMKWLRGAGR